MNRITANTTSKNYQTRIRAGAHVIFSDEPLDLGGGDTGFAPTELLAASLASCTAITLRMYIDRKAWNIEEVQIEVEAVKNEKGIIIAFNRSLSFVPEVEDAVKSRLLAIAQRCPVHQAIEKSIEINTQTI